MQWSRQCNLDVGCPRAPFKWVDRRLSSHFYVTIFRFRLCGCGLYRIPPKNRKSEVFQSRGFCHVRGHFDGWSMRTGTCMPPSSAISFYSLLWKLNTVSFKSQHQKCVKYRLISCPSFGNVCVYYCIYVFNEKVTTMMISLVCPCGIDISVCVGHLA